MNQTNKYVIWGVLIFTLLVMGALASIYAAQTGFTTLLFTCNIVIIILSLGLLLLLMQTIRVFVKDEEEIARLKKSEKIRLQKGEHTGDQWQHQETFRVDEMLARIIPAAGTHFSSAAAFSEKVLQNIAKEMDIVQGLVFVLNDADQLFHISGEYAYFSEEQPRSFPLGETLSGQVAKSQKMLNLTELPEGYIAVISGLGKSNPRHLVIAPMVHNDESIGVMELASFKPLGENEESLIRNICASAANVLNELRNQYEQ